MVFIGSAFFYAFITSINENFFFWIIPFAGALMVLLVYLISLKLLNSRVFSILAAIVFFSSPIVVRVSTSSYNMALASAFFLAAVFFMLLLQKRAFIIFSGILFSISFFLRQDFLLFLPAMLLFIYLSAKKDWRRNFAHFLAPVVAFALLTLLLNLAYFNDAFFTPYGFSDSNPCIAQGSNGPKQPIEIVARYLFRFNELGPLELFGMIARHFVYFFQSSFAFPLAVFSVIGLLLFFKENKKFFLGGGSNILVGDLGFRGLVIKNEAESMVISGGILTAESGVKMVKLAAFANENSLAGLEVFMSVPGSLGGAVYNNSHFRPEKGEFIGNLVESVELLYKGLALPSKARPYKTKWKRVTVDRDWFNFGYDYSRLHDEPGVVLKVKFSLKTADPEKLKKSSMELLKERNSRQPVGQSSCGCMFKNPDGLSAGQLIDDAEMKGKRVGGAMVS
ncbi:MAG TPA: FAD-binding protein, partial [Candidatus Diapherotrites archaeon]|nr:FAD-binding protein [Candidatus Diapherotrites archaeon]